MADGRGQGVPREVPSVALDRLFLELHDQLPRDAKGNLAQLADEVKRLTEPSTAEAPVIPPSSVDQAVVRREEEIATAEAKQSSGELQAQGKAYCMLSAGIIWIWRSLQKVDYIASYMVTAGNLLSTVVSCRCGCYVTQRPAHPEWCSVFCRAPCSIQVVQPRVDTRYPALCLGWCCSSARESWSTQGDVCQVARRISWHREPAPHMADCPRCCRNDLWFSSHGRHSHRSTKTEDPSCRWVQHFFPSDLGECISE